MRAASLAFHPGFATNHLFYVYYNQKNPAGQRTQPLNFPFRSIISEFKVSATNADAADLASERILLQVQQPFGNHKGGELALGPDGYLYLGLGDGGAGDDPLGNGQSTATLLAKSAPGRKLQDDQCIWGYPPAVGIWHSERQSVFQRDQPW